MVDKQADWTSHDIVAKVRGLLRQSVSQGLESGASHEDKVQGTGEKQSEHYKRYSERASEPVTQQFASRQSRVAGSARKQDLAVRSPRVKVGHTGTLDPFATGLLILVVGSYTKRAQEFSGMDKTYEAEMVLGATSTTGDPEGEITQLPTLPTDRQATNYQLPSQNDIEAVFSQFKGTQMQMPHKYSAKKVNGQKAYNLARAGKDVKLEPKEITVHSLKLTAYSYPSVKFTAKVSSGTYIRSLAEDIGAKLGTGAYLSSLRRTSVGDYSVEDALLLDQLPENIALHIQST